MAYGLMSLILYCLFYVKASKSFYCLHKQTLFFLKRGFVLEDYITKTFSEVNS